MVFGAFITTEALRTRRDAKRISNQDTKRNYDWTIGDALVLVNKRGVAKTATIIDSDNGAKWVSKYGSVTFNQYGRENPTGGMNEMGLVVEQMWLDETE